MTSARRSVGAAGKSASSSHLDERGALRMVDVSEKAVTRRLAVAEARVRVSAATIRLLKSGTLSKGDAAPVVRLAAVQGAKRTADLVPLCHPISLEHVAVDLSWAPRAAVIRVTAVAVARTGVEMEAMAGAVAGALTLYDMIKGRERGAVIESVRLLRKEGGRSGTYIG